MARGDVGKRFEGYQIYDQRYEEVGKFWTGVLKAPISRFTVL